MPQPWNPVTSRYKAWKPAYLQWVFGQSSWAAFVWGCGATINALFGMHLEIDDDQSPPMLSTQTSV
ncbi:Protein of unknown function [Pyronema omphalodes CBS 100304]|uniref:Uncharacterized protein n=1 Tax=Pyronema omphalodes (strain CBS 100304) TaxID=1076935 RepID=U4LBR3_PYROM|nr:Protein of unknown function [Pyronema omphalodes CBS 100304]